MSRCSEDFTNDEPMNHKRFVMEYEYSMTKRYDLVRPGHLGCLRLTGLARQSTESGPSSWKYSANAASSYATGSRSGSGSSLTV